MAKQTKADLIAAAEERGFILTGDETASELATLLSEEQPDTEPVVEEPAPPTEQEQAVVDATAQVAEAQMRLDEAKAALDQAKAYLAEVSKPKRPVFGEHILMEGSLEPVKIPNADGPYQRRLTIGGVNYEHVGEVEFTGDDDKPFSIWTYRRM